MTYIALHRDTLSDMSKMVSVRIPDDVFAALQRQARAEERSVSQVIVRTLRGKQLMIGAIKGEAEKPPDVIEFANGSKIVNVPLPNEDRYRKCSHGDNEYTCDRVACKIKTGRA